MFTLVTFIHHTAGSSSQINKAKKKKKTRYRDYKEEIKVSLFEDDMIVCTENPINIFLKKSTNKATS